MSIRSEYERRGARKFYEERGGSYANPHEPQLLEALDDALQRWPVNLSNVLDLAAGSGEITLALRKHGAGKTSGIDPYTYQAYESRTGQSAERFSFEQIAEGALAGRHYSLIVCSFAMHLCEKSRLPALCLQLSMISPALLIFTPHKRPTIREEWGWKLSGEFVLQRIRARMYNSCNTQTHGSPNRQPGHRA
jgi:hypothetical protein